MMEADGGARTNAVRERGVLERRAEEVGGGNEGRRRRKCGQSLMWSQAHGFSICLRAVVHNERVPHGSDPNPNQK